VSSSPFILLMHLPPPRSPLFPYTTLFRSRARQPCSISRREPLNNLVGSRQPLPLNLPLVLLNGREEPRALTALVWPVELAVPIRAELATEQQLVRRSASPTDLARTTGLNHRHPVAASGDRWSHQPRLGWNINYGCPLGSRSDNLCDLLRCSAQLGASVLR